MVRMEIKRSIGEALAVLQFDEFGLPVHFPSATLYLFCLSCTANILPLSKKKRRTEAELEMLLTHIQMEKSEKVKGTLELRADEVILPTSFDLVFNQVSCFQGSPAQTDSQNTYSIHIKKITNIETNLIPQKIIQIFTEAVACH